MAPNFFYGSPHGNVYISLTLDVSMWGLGLSLKQHQQLYRLMAAVGPVWFTLGRIRRPAAHLQAHRGGLSPSPLQRKAS